MGRVPTRFVAVGQRFGRGVVIDPEVRVPYEAPSGYSREWRCVRLRCDCGTEYVAQMGALFRGKRISCGCARRRQRDPVSVARQRATLEARGRITEHVLYSTWANMMRRCYKESNGQYLNYGARGVRVHDPWHDSRTFIADIERLLGERPDRCTLDRKDNNGNYAPDNVKWSTPTQQSRNTRRSLSGSVRYRGKGRWGFRLSAGGFFSEQVALDAQRRAIEVLEREGILT
jgi:hypothetical protein